MKRLWGAAMAACLGAGIAQAADDVCPPVSIDPAMRNMVSYPGGEPGRRKQDYSYIAAVLSADATCTTDDDDRVIADVTITYAIEAGTLYRGSADLEVTAIVRDGPAEAGRGTSKKTSAPSADGKPMTVTDTIRGLVIGDEDAVADGNFSISAGFSK